MTDPVPSEERNVQAQRIGQLTPTARGFRASCGLAHCVWSLERESKKDAEESLRGHAAVSHPVAIPIYREVPA